MRRILGMTCLHDRWFTTALVSLLLLCPLLAAAQPVTEWGNRCWQLQPFTTDVLELAITEMTPIGVKNMFRLSGEWSSAAYQLPCTGAAFSTQTGYKLGVVCTNESGLFSGDASISLNGLLVPSGNGVWTLEGSNGFPNPGVPGQNLLLVTCGLPLPTSAMAIEGAAGGDEVE